MTPRSARLLTGALGLVVVSVAVALPVAALVRRASGPDASGTALSAPLSAPLSGPVSPPASGPAVPPLEREEPAGSQGSGPLSAPISGSLSGPIGPGFAPLVGFLQSGPGGGLALAGAAGLVALSGRRLTRLLGEP